MPSRPTEAGNGNHIRIKIHFGPPVSSTIPRSLVAIAGKQGKDPCTLANASLSERVTLVLVNH